MEETNLFGMKQMGVEMKKSEVLSHGYGWWVGLRVITTQYSRVSKISVNGVMNGFT